MTYRRTASDEGLTYTFITAVFGAAILFVGILIAGLVVMNNAEKIQYEFEAKCIEYQTIDRCREIYRYHREDLMTKKVPQ